MDDHNADNVHIANHHHISLSDADTYHTLSLPFDARPLAIEVAFADVGRL